MMQHAAQDHPQNLEMNLREQLLAAGPPATHPSPYPPPPNAGATDPNLPYHPSDPTSPHNHLDPNVAQSQQQAPYAPMGGDAGDSPGEDGMSPSGSKGKRELSQSKRAAQNRAAQRAFRQRKEGYIKKLEEQVKEFQNMESNYRQLQNENYQLREYILNLQSRLLESSSDVPPAPSHINLSGGRSAAEPAVPHDQRYQIERQRPDERRSEVPDSMSQLQAAAAQAEAASRQPQHESPYGLGADSRAYIGQQGAIDGEGKASS
ncbi:hypothetical protein BAUCODRAFT_269899 [Baudoinia panamericana UAMH 10762]|uniref:Putative transcription factor kapC n=1 Tax=Baudoinia panamericana (strain UAMH 10762) TaxID=717646 RepID=M2LG55_BAUPA|nr:uncharacterized protein BAUCODRAFT_269899 [Baudoinia panamericana UAMH 10762]EMC93002.1 hypothetical protein BAUCODRAFT_269899 [Baudoinia panamericana UAMH 10762]